MNDKHQLMRLIFDVFDGEQFRVIHYSDTENIYLEVRSINTSQIQELTATKQLAFIRGLEDGWIQMRFSNVE